MADNLDHLPRDSNGCPIEHTWIDGQEVIVHYDDIPESDITTLHGIRVTTPLRTVIDIAPDVDLVHLHAIVQDCLDRRLFTVEDALTRINEPDITDRPGAACLRRVLAS